MHATRLDSQAKELLVQANSHKRVCKLKHLATMSSSSAAAFSSTWADNACQFAVNPWVRWGLEAATATLEVHEPQDAIALMSKTRFADIASSAEFICGVLTKYGATNLAAKELATAIVLNASPAPVSMPTNQTTVLAQGDWPSAS